MTGTPGDVLWTLAGVAMLVAGPVLLYLDPKGRANRAFAALTLAQGGFMLTVGMGVLAGSVAEAVLWWSLTPHFAVAVPFAVAYFVAVYPRDRGWVPEGLPTWTPFLAGALVAEAVVAVSPSLYWDLATVDAALVASPASPAWGPFGLAFWVGELAFLSAGLVLARDFVRAPRGAPRVAMVLVGLGLFAPASCNCGTATFLNKSWWTNWILLGAPASTDALVAGPAVGVAGELLVLAVVAMLLVVFSYVAYQAVRSHDAQVRRILRRFGLLFGTAVALVVFVYSPWGVPGDRLPTMRGLVGFWALVGLALVGYGVARHSLFDLDLKVKWTVKQSTVAAAFIAVFFLVSEGAQEFFAAQAGLGPYLGIGAAAVLVFALAPLQRLAENVADRAVPGTKEVSEMDGAERAQLFREQVELVWMDGTLSSKDRLVLSNLRDRLGLDTEEAERIEVEVVEGAGGHGREALEPSAAT